MALYHVQRVDAVKPGEFVEGFVIAGGVAQARMAVARYVGVRPIGSNIIAVRVDTTGEPRVVATYWDESPTLDDALSA